MEERSWERLGAFAGIAFVVLSLLAAFLYPQEPRIDSSAATTLAWVHNHRTAIQAGMILGVFAAGIFVWFVGHLQHALHRAERGAETLAPIVFGSGLAAGILGALGAVPLGLLAFMDAQPGGLQDATVVRMLADLGVVLYGAGVVMTAVFFAALGWAVLRRELRGGWLGWVSLMVAALNALAVVTSMSFSTYHGAGWGVPGWGAYLGGLVVVLAVAIGMLRGAPSDVVEVETVVLTAS
jgi:MFS family permease